MAGQTKALCICRIARWASAADLQAAPADSALAIAATVVVVVDATGRRGGSSAELGSDDDAVVAFALPRHDF